MNAVPKISSFNQFLAAVVAAESAESNETINPDLKAAAAALGQSEGVGTTGGYLVPEEFAPEIWSRVYSTGRILARCDRQPIGGNGDKLSIPAIAERDRKDAEEEISGDQPEGSRFGGAQMYWTDEAAPPPESRFKLEMIKLTLKKLLGLIYTSDELIQDVAALGASLLRMFGLEAAFQIENAIVNGDGVAKPLGILKSDSLIIIGKDGSQVAGTVSATNLSNMAAALWGPSHGKAIWLMGNDVYAKILELEDKDGSSLFETGPEGQRMLLQMPVELCEYTAPLGAEGDLVLADFSQYILAERAADLLSSIHVKFTADESAFKLRYRADGQPAWRTAITPRNSTNKQSPFVALGARAA